MKFLKPIMNADAIPPNIVLVNEDYPIDCTQYISILDPKQQKYAVSGFGTGPEKIIFPRETSPESNKSLQVKQTRSKKWDDPPEKQTPPRSQSQSQLNPLNGDAESSPGVWLLPKESEEPGFVQSPKETTPPVDDDSRSSSETAQPPRLGLISGLGDALDQAISEAKKYQHLPLDDEDDENESRPSSSESNGLEDSDDSERDRSPIRAPKKTKHKKKGAANQENFSCMHGGTGVAVESNPNGVTISILQEMADYYERTRDKWRSFSYRKAIGTLKKQTQKIRYYDEAIALPHVGHRIATKIEEIAATNRLRRLDNVKLEPVDIILQTFTKIYGADVSTASKWIQAGLKTLDDLKTRGKLTKNQRIGLDHYEDFNTQIPREEVTALGEIVKRAAGAIDPEVQAIIGGSYRRGAKMSGDIDFILTKPGTSSSHQLLPFLADLVNRLTDDEFLVAALAEPRSLREGAKWHGACVLPGNPIWRRIDFLVVPESEFGAALIYFTGDDIFNRSMRLLSKTKGMRLNQRGLYKNVMRGPAGVKPTEGALVEGAEEKEIFKILDVPWRPPEQRVCH
jgi:DNA polymerase IV